MIQTNSLTCRLIATANIKSKNLLSALIYITTNICTAMCAKTETIATAIPEDVTKSLEDIKDLLGNILETLEILTDPVLMSQIRSSEIDIKKGKVTKFA